MSDHSAQRTSVLSFRAAFLWGRHRRGWRYGHLEATRSVPPARPSAGSSCSEPQVSKGFPQRKEPHGARENLTGAEIQGKRDGEGEVASFISTSFRIKK